jgi:hypothetical protein
VGDLVQIVDKVVMVDPVNACLDEAEEIDEDEREGLTEPVHVFYFLAGYMKLEDHDGDDHGDDAVGECFEPGGAQAILFFRGHAVEETS